MLPHFSNPNLLPQLTVSSSRAELYTEDVQDLPASPAADLSAIEELNRLIKHSLPEIRYEAPVTAIKAAVDNKLRALDPDSLAKEEEDLVLFRLVSSSQPPLLLSLLPPPPPPSIMREPDAEDTEEQAARRTQRAEAAFVDGADVIRESLLSNATLYSHKQATQLKASISWPEPRMLVVRTLQIPRKTRPPVPLSQLSHFPYVSDTSKMPIQPPNLKTPECLTVDELPASRPARKRGRRRGVKVEIARPLPQFWRPSPNMKGKCRGYAYGYPSNLSLADTSYVKGGVSRPWKYKRDTMKTGTFSSIGAHDHASYGYGPNKR